MDNKQHYLPWVAIWGAVFGVASGIPMLNCCCCFLWFPLAGLLSVMNVSNKANVTIPLAEGAVLGLIAGAIAGVMSGVMSGAFQALSSSNMGAVADMYRNIPNMPPEVVALLEAQATNPAAGFFQSCCLHSVIGPACGALGGLIGSAVFKKGPGTGGALPQPQAY
jgi:hypothetical protein